MSRLVAAACGQGRRRLRSRLEDGGTSTAEFWVALTWVHACGRHGNPDAIRRPMRSVARDVPRPLDAACAQQTIRGDTGRGCCSWARDDARIQFWSEGTSSTTPPARGILTTLPAALAALCACGGISSTISDKGARVLFCSDSRAWLSKIVSTM